MKRRAFRFGILGIVVVIIIIGGLTFHHFRNRPFAVVGYYSPNANGALKNIGNHFDKNGMLEVEFHYKEPTGEPNVVFTDHYTYTVLKDGSGKPIKKRYIWNLKRYTSEQVTVGFVWFSHRSISQRPKTKSW